MRAPGDMPPPPRVRPSPGAPRSRVWLVALGIALFVVLTSLRGVAGFYTDYLWFDSLNFSGVFTGVLGTKIGLGAVFSLIFFVVLWVNLFIADRLAPRFRPSGPEEEVVERYHELVGERTGLVRAGLAGVFALIAGAGVSSRWNDWILFTNARDFGIEDPQFGTDAGFYVFQLPFLTFLVDWAFAALVIVAIVVTIAHYLNGGIRFQGASQRVSVQVKAHLSVILGALALLRAAAYWLQRYELTLSTRGTVHGATYTDVNAQLPALELLTLISLAAFVLFIINIRRRGWILPAFAVGTWVLAAVVVGGIYPAFVQRFQVVPAESSREAPFITHNIAATRFALGLDDVATTDFAADDALDGATLQDNAETVRNIRLWDPEFLLPSYQRLQEVRPQYQILDVDVDRYDIDGQPTQVELSARELDTPGVPQDSWEARHLTYTHGYGAVAAPANSKTADGRPELIMSDIPVDGTPSINLEGQPGIYVGEGLSDYVMVNTAREEIDFQNEEGTQFTEYDGADGVDVGSYLRRAAFALRFGDINPLISSSVRPDSKILYQRDIRERAQALAPFLSFDADPYVVIIGGRVQYVLDAYTTSASYPYAQQAETGALLSTSGLNHNFNYIRNSVKAVIDAYDGTMTFYVVDPDDPLIAVYQEAFPELFTDQNEVPAELREHFRYPEDLFRTQTTMWGRYHIENADDFYNNNDGWNVAQDPGAGSATQVNPAVDPVTGAPLGQAQEARIDPYYLLMRLPGDDELSFVMLRPFVPVSADDGRKELTAFMVAKSDPGSYGELETFVMPRSNLPDGPAIVGANMQQDQEVSELQTLLGGEGRSVQFGNLVIIPVEQSLLYVRPFYVISQSTEIPELRKVIVSFSGRVVVEDTLDQALVELFGESPGTLEELPTPGADPPVDDAPADPGAPGGPPPGDAPPPNDGTDVAGLLGQAQAAFDRAEAALAAGDLGTYQQEVEAGRALVIRARQQADPAAATTTTAPPSTTPPPSTTAPPAPGSA